MPGSRRSRFGVAGGMTPSFKARSPSTMTRRSCWPAGRVAVLFGSLVGRLSVGGCAASRRPCQRVSGGDAGGGALTGPHLRNLQQRQRQGVPSVLARGFQNSVLCLANHATGAFFQPLPRKAGRKKCGTCRRKRSGVLSCSCRPRPLALRLEAGAHEGGTRVVRLRTCGRPTPMNTCPTKP